jgi:hypothetical protein
MTGHTFSFNPAVREPRDDNDPGEIYYIHSARLNPGYISLT